MSDNLKSIKELMRKGVTLFNDHLFYESHEAFEDAWRLAGQEGHHATAELCQALVQAAALLHHWRDGNLRGACLLKNRVRPRLEAVNKSERGLSVEPFRMAFLELIAPLGLESAALSESALESLPKLVMSVGD